MLYSDSSKKNECEIFSEEKLSQAGQKNNEVLVKYLFTKTHFTVLKLHK